jgi:hypothetical protein
MKNEIKSELWRIPTVLLLLSSILAGWEGHRGGLVGIAPFIIFIIITILYFIGVYVNLKSQ